ncbi:MAG TPA: non-canonical purine NTP pyrophosphatase [Patescibacteria group bacterium]|nr:non-canonical purine NTP pyrophosphatase [Patescibacteria group bacterium]
MTQILIATTNPGKVEEITRYLSDLPVQFVSLKDVGIVDEVEEDGTTYEQNSQKKALTYSKLSGLPAISDDGGLEIAALNNEPGVNTKYWGGPEGRDEDLVKKMEQVILDLPQNNRNARFVAVLSFALPNGKVWSRKSHVDLLVADKPLHSLVKGFPYRSFLIVPQLNKYYHESELTENERKEYNHRYKALMELKKIIKKELGL